MTTETNAKPTAENFMRECALSGVVVAVKHVREHATFARRGGCHGFACVVGTGPVVSRLEVQIRTDAGWILTGKIGAESDARDLPPIAIGSRLAIDPVILCMSNASLGLRRRGIYRPRSAAQTLTGKIVRA
jgi:hypothetical protein